MSEDDQNEDFNIRETLEKYLSHWQWFALGAFLCLAISYVYLRYSTPQYQASTTILVKDEKKGGMLSELSAFSDMGLGNALKNNVDNEIEILKSRSLVENTVKNLKLNVVLIKHGNIASAETFRDGPIDVDFITIKPEFYKSKMLLEFIEVSSDRFSLESKLTSEAVPTLPKDKKEYGYGEIIPTAIGDLVVSKPILLKNAVQDRYQSIDIRVSPLDAVVASYLSRLKVNPVSKTSSVVEISITDPIVKRAEVFLDKLIQIYNDAAAADKNFISENTSKFIKERLVLITKELDGVEQNVESFKQSNSLTDIESEAELFIAGSNEYNKKSVENEIQLNVVASMLDFLKKSTTADLLPANIISEKGEASELISSYNQLVLERNRILKSATVANPTVVALDQQILSLKANVGESLRRMQSSLTIQKRNLKNQEGLLDSKIGKIPVQERQFRVIARQQKVKEELYLYLMEKREETAISLAATAPNARVIDAAKAAISPVSPKKNIIYLAALLLGILIPFGILYVKDLLDTKVKSRFDITDKFSIPFLGDIPRSSTPNEIIDTTSRTSTAEALRIVRANLDYMLTQVADGQAKSIFVTSTIPGEGKTFLSVNMASIFAHAGKKVLLVGMDIRKPKLNEYVGITDPKGLTDYLSAKNVVIADYINQMQGYEAFDVLLGGVIPPNPTELLMSRKVDELFAQLKKEYDYIIVDTAPVSLVSDTMIIAKHADTFAYVVRANYLDKRMLALPDILHREHKLPNMAFILNDTAVSKGYGYGGYGYGGYGYGGVEKKKKPWYKTIFKK
ncbi:polysaccharide biosynthesis tyrosine autokinase [Flavobacterium nackdongense]|uniref:non-specific protein-tyrosine kinase n=2 Tax=Flavobacterium nackdongense TaxID=2547394 RepID=A0A4P6YI89_9FLAO|nr:polysaccharide biosynthesis tyrosine autokinase [Flavobacterium nackdongense]